MKLRIVEDLTADPTIQPWYQLQRWRQVHDLLECTWDVVYSGKDLNYLRSKAEVMLGLREGIRIIQEYDSEPEILIDEPAKTV